MGNNNIIRIDRAKAGIIIHAHSAVMTVVTIVALAMIIVARAMIIGTPVMILVPAIIVVLTHTETGPGVRLEVNPRQQQRRK